VQVTWNDIDPVHTVKAEQNHIPPPASPSEEELDRVHKNCGQNIVTWCETSFGTVGAGKCWALVETVPNELAQAYLMYWEEPLLISKGRPHGCRILTVTAGTLGTNAALLQLADVWTGDILEMRAAHFRTVEEAPVDREKWEEWQKGARENKVRLADHTAVITGFEGDLIEVMEQNGAVPLILSEGNYNLTKMVRGRPVSIELWARKGCPLWMQIGTEIDGLPCRGV